MTTFTFLFFFKGRFISYLFSFYEVGGSGNMLLAISYIGISFANPISVVQTPFHCAQKMLMSNMLFTKTPSTFFIFAR
jgi:hypothetical protein